MPLNKNASFRYRVINECLRNTSRRWTFTDLLERVSVKLQEEFDIQKGISARQLADDIHIMRKLPPTGYNAPIKRQGGYIFYEDPSYSIDQNPLSEVDIQSLNEALSLLKQFKDLPHYDDLKRIPDKIQGTLNLHSKERALIQFETNLLVKGTEWIPTLSDCIREKKAVTVIYKPFKNVSQITDLVHPYLLKEYRNRWFLLGFNEKLSVISNYALDRIVEVNPTSNVWIEQKTFDPEHHFDNVIGVSIGIETKPQRIRIKVAPDLLPYLITKPLHKSQTLIKETNQYSIIELYLIHNYELESLLLSFGDQAEVLIPKSIRIRIAERLERASSSYQTEGGI